MALMQLGSHHPGMWAPAAAAAVTSSQHELRRQLQQQLLVLQQQQQQQLCQSPMFQQLCELHGGSQERQQQQQQHVQCAQTAQQGYGVEPHDCQQQPGDVVGMRLGCCIVTRQAARASSSCKGHDSSLGTCRCCQRC